MDLNRNWTKQDNDKMRELIKEGKDSDFIRNYFSNDKLIYHPNKKYYIAPKSSILPNFKNKISQSEVVNIMKNSGVKEISKFIKGRASLSGYIKGTPVHVKSAINYNDLLTMNNITDIEPISDGEKVKWAYLVNNPLGFDSLALRGYHDPEVTVNFVSQYIDRNKMFESDFKGKLDDFYAARGWSALPNSNNVQKFFKF